MPISCRTLTTVVPCARKQWTCSNQSTWCGGSKLASGSSMSMMDALAAMARANSTRWRSPPESSPSVRSRQSQAWVALSAASHICASCAVGVPHQPWCGKRPSMATSHTRRSNVVASPCPNQDSCNPRCRRSKFLRSWPCHRTWPLVGNKPAKALSKLDLPAPLGPTTQVQRPAGMRTSSPCKTARWPNIRLSAWASSAGFMRDHQTRTCGTPARANNRRQ